MPCWPWCPLPRLGRHAPYSSGHSSLSPSFQQAALDSRGLPSRRRPFVRGHQCKRVFYLEAHDFTDDNDTPTEHETADSTAVEEVTTDAMANALVVSLYALAGIRTAKSMVVPVLIKGERFLALLDTGSTHNFLRGDTMQRLGLATFGGKQLRVTVGNGDRLPCASIARNVPIVIGGAVFSVTCAGIDLGGFDFILGIDFLRTLGPILWDLEAMTVSFLHRGTRVQWQGVHPAVPQPHVAVVSATDQQPMLDILLEQQGAIFFEPTGLPPARPYNHRIHLLPGTEPVAVRPYRYPQLQKDELERQCMAMLAQGIIRPSTSPFSGPAGPKGRQVLTLLHRLPRPQRQDAERQVPNSSGTSSMAPASSLSWTSGLATTRCGCTRATLTRPPSAPTTATTSSWLCRLDFQTSRLHSRP
jgi:hypothetical protein